MSEEKDKPDFDEQTLARLLEAAYVLQEHNRESLHAGKDVEPKPGQPNQDVVRASPGFPAAGEPAHSSASPLADLPLAQIIETQHKIQARNLEVESAMSLVAERVVEISRAAGAAIGIVEGKLVRYRAVAGQKTPAAGSDVPLDKALCVPCVRTGEAFRCADITPATLLDTEECRRRGIQSLVAVPVFAHGAPAGGLEVYYADPRAFTEQDVQTCQLMAGLITEALTREEQTSSKQSLVNERTRMLDALEKLKPNLSALLDRPATTEARAASGYACAKCGHQLIGDEQFCGQCGSARRDQASADQNKVDSLATSAAATTAAKAEPTLTIDEQDDIDHILSGTSLDELAKSLETEMAAPFTDSDLEVGDTDESAELSAKLLNRQDPETETSAGAKLDSKGQPEGNEKETEEEQEESVALAKPAVSANWSSAHSAREFLEQLAGTGRQTTLARFWNERRGDIYLAIAVILVACVIRWGIWSNSSVDVKAAPNTPAAHHKPSPDADLSFFDRMLISMGLAEATEPPEDKGNPSTQVWVDLHTALYYCPGADLYGKTQGGKYTSQREAQLDQFEPAYRKTCK